MAAADAAAMLAATTCGGGTIRLREGDYIARPVASKAGNFSNSAAACCGAVAGAAPLITTERVMAEATKAASTPATRAGDLRDAAIWTSEAVCCVTIPSVDTAPL